jgi:hypothetical protein
MCCLKRFTGLAAVGQALCNAAMFPAGFTEIFLLKQAFLPCLLVKWKTL